MKPGIALWESGEHIEQARRLAEYAYAETGDAASLTLMDGLARLREEADNLRRLHSDQPEDMPDDSRDDDAKLPTG